MTERGSNHHSPRIDDELGRETESLTRGAPVESRAEDWRRQEGPADGEPMPDARIASAPDDDAAANAAPDLDEVEARSLLATSLRPSAFPANRDALLAVAEEQHAEPQVMAWLRALPGDDEFATVQDVWQAIGGAPERRDRSSGAETVIEAPDAPLPERALAVGRAAVETGVGLTLQAVSSAMSAGRRAVSFARGVVGRA